MVPIYEAFYERFRPDWFHLQIGYPRSRRGFPSSEYHGVLEGDRRYLIAPDGSREEILADKSVVSENKWHEELARNRPDLSSRDSIDEYVARFYSITAEQIIQSGYTDHAAEIVRKRGDQVFVCVHGWEPCGPVAFSTGKGSGRAFEDSLLALHDNLPGVKYLLERRYETALEWVKAFASVGVHGWAVSHSFSGSDTVSPRLYRELQYDADCWYFAQVRRYGMIPLVFFCGDVRPLLPLIADSGMAGLMLEDNRKTFEFDVFEITRQLQGKVCLFGNLDTCFLLCEGAPEEVEAAVKAQLEAAHVGPFIVCNGSPIVPGTAPENIDAMIRAARLYGRYPLG
jgi:hypothetical protein